MLVYQALDLITEHYGRIKNDNEEKQNQKDMKEAPELAYKTTCFLGLMLQVHVCEFELDVYGYLTSTKYKYFLIKNEHHQIQRNLASIVYNQSSSSQNQQRLLLQ